MKTNNCPACEYPAPCACVKAYERLSIELRRLRRVVRAAERWNQCKSESFSSMDRAYVLARQRLSDAVAAYRKTKTR